MLVITREKKITSVIIAIAFLFNAICLAANLIIPSFAGFGDVLAIALLLIGLCSCFPVLKISYNALLICVTILFMVLVSYFIYGQASEIFSLLKNYIVWGIGISVILMQPFDLEKTLDTAMVLSTSIIIADLILNADIHYESMVWTYAIFPCIATMLIHFVYRRHKSWFGKLLYIPGIIMFFKFILNSNRGGLFSLAFLLYFIIMRKISKGTKYTSKRGITSVIVLLVICILAINYEAIVEALYNLLSANDIKVSAVNKMYRLIMTENVLNNRSELYEFAWKGFLESPIWGNGVGAFSVNHGGWAHNLFLQVLYEGGVLLFSLVFIPLLIIIYHMVWGDKVKKENYAFLVLLFCTSIPRLLFSTEIWNTQSFWMLLVFGLISINNEKRIKNEKRLEENKNEYSVSRREI